MGIETDNPFATGTSHKEKISRNDLLLHVLIIGLGLIIATPVLIALFSSFKIPTEILTFPPTLFPTEWTVENYITAWTSKPFGRFFMNSIIQTGIIVIFQVMFSILAAYAFSSLKFPGRDFLFYFVLGSLMVPFQLTFIPNFLLITSCTFGKTPKRS